jgi:nuclear pore complex protein Nup93
VTLTTREDPQINFGRMIGYYTRDFRAANVTAATDYLTMICLNANLPGALGKSQAALCHEALRELVLETREYAQLLGDIRRDGARVKGAIEQRLKLIGLDDQEAFLQTVTLQAASVADDNGRTTDAVLLYHLAEDYDNVLAICNRSLSDALAVDLGQEQTRLQPLKPRTGGPGHDPDSTSMSLTAIDSPSLLARSMVALYNGNALVWARIRAVNRETGGLLIRMSEARTKVEAGEWAEALDVNPPSTLRLPNAADPAFQLIASLSLLPLSAHGTIAVIRAAAQNLSNAPPAIARLIGPLLLWAMTCISRERERLDGVGQGGFDNDARRSVRDGLARQAKDLMVFAGLVKLRLGKGVWEGIVSGAGEVGAY